jgi:hypothetical protein
MPTNPSHSNPSLLAKTFIYQLLPEMLPKPLANMLQLLQILILIVIEALLLCHLFPGSCIAVDLTLYGPDMGQILA